ncbi:MAG: hypothetical protein LBV16_00630 [Elusimicrobiota bacterium]|jgi:hypothetical protein|nr:hypothetical protein [Elusimicrobiota bacterium]
MADKSEFDKIDVEFEKFYGEEHFIDDGIVDVEAFNKAKHKILWILKEANDEDQTSWNIRS